MRVRERLSGGVYKTPPFLIWGTGASRERGLAGTVWAGSHNFDFEPFSPDSYLGISKGKALVVGE